MGSHKIVQQSNSSWRTGLLFLAILLLGLSLRLYRLDEQSLWYDDFNGTLCVNETSLTGYLTCFYEPSSPNREHVPLYFIGQYFWTRCFGTSTYGLRLYSITLGMGTLTLLFLFARALGGAKVGLIAALCYALSPFHIFYDQSLRTYPLVSLASAGSLYTFVHLWRQPRPTTWITHAVFNLMLLWAHVFGVFLIAIEGFCLLFLFPRAPRRCVQWGILQAFLLIPTIIWILGIPIFDQGSFRLYSAPDLKFFLCSLIALDTPPFNVELLPSPTTWSWLGNPLDTFLLSRQRMLAMAFLSIVLTLLLWQGTHIAYSAWRKTGEERRNACVAPLFAGIIAFMPITLLAIVSHVWRPCFFPRYFIYASFGLYTLIGFALHTLPRPWLKRGALSVFLLLLLTQLSLTLPADVRTPWKRVIHFLEQNAKPEEPVFIGYDLEDGAFPAYDVFLRQTEPNTFPTIPSDTFDALIQQCQFLNSQQTGNASSRAWWICQREYALYELTELNKKLAEAGFTYQVHPFPGMECLTLYALQCPPQSDIPVQLTQRTSLPVQDYAHAITLAQMGWAYARYGDYSIAQSAFALANQIEPGFVPFQQAIEAKQWPTQHDAKLHQLFNMYLPSFWGELPDNKELYPLALHLLQKVQSTDYPLAMLHLTLGMVHYAAQEYAKAEQAFRKHNALNPVYAEGDYFLISALLKQNKKQAALQQFQALFARMPEQRKAWSALVNAYFSSPDPERVALLLQDLQKAASENTLGYNALLSAISAEVTTTVVPRP